MLAVMSILIGRAAHLTQKGLVVAWGDRRSPLTSEVAFTAFLCFNEQQDAENTSWASHKHENGRCLKIYKDLASPPAWDFEETFKTIYFHHITYNNPFKIISEHIHCNIPS